jgi:hypothetical protein
MGRLTTIIKSRLWVFISIVATLILSVISIIIYTNKVKHEQKSIEPKIVGIIFGFSILAGITIGGIYRAVTYVPPSSSDKYSTTRMERLNELFTSYFGSRWPLVLTIFVFFLVIILSQLYRLMENGIEVSLNDENFSMFNKYFLTWSIFYTVMIGVFAAIAIKDMRKDQVELSEEQGDFYEETKMGDLTKVVLLGILALTILSIVIWLVIRQFSVTRNLKV